MYSFVWVLEIFSVFESVQLTLSLTLILGMRGLLLSLHWTCLSFFPISMSFIMAPQSGRFRGRLRRASIFSVCSRDIGLESDKTSNYMENYFWKHNRLNVRKEHAVLKWYYEWVDRGCTIQILFPISFCFALKHSLCSS